jgi:hypothetical protein
MAAAAATEPTRPAHRSSAPNGAFFLLFSFLALKIPCLSNISKEDSDICKASLQGFYNHPKFNTENS